MQLTISKSFSLPNIFMIVCGLIANGFLSSALAAPINAYGKNVPKPAAMPNWWHQECLRRREMAQVMKYENIRLSQIYKKQMTNQKSTLSIAYRRTFSLTHKNLRTLSAPSQKTVRTLHS